MPLTAKGKKIMAEYVKEYGSHAKEYFYRSVNSGRISGVHAGEKPQKKRESR